VQQQQIETEQDSNRGEVLYHKFETGNIESGELIEFRKILDNEVHIAITEGKFQTLVFRTVKLEEVNDYMRKKGIPK